MPNNADLNKANKNKKDEFYTQLTDIEKEMRYYTEHFKGKVVFCNCDDPEYSNFWKYFELNFDRLGLKRLIATHYEVSKPSYKLELIGDTDGDGRVDKHDIVRTTLRTNGDFRSPECIEILKQSDIIVTNPPFSLFREYIRQLMEYGKKFIIIGNMNAIHYKEIFPYIKDNKLWIGPSVHSGDRMFNVPDDYPLNAAGCGVGEEGRKYIRVKGIRWFTNIDISQRHEEIILYRNYTPDRYPHYFNYDGIDVNSVSEIPCDYYGNMGVPDNFIDVYNPDQFEIVGLGTEVPKTMLHTVVGDQIQYVKDGEVIWSTPYTVAERKAGNSLRLNENGLPGKLPYSRIIIRRKIKQ